MVRGVLAAHGGIAMQQVGRFRWVSWLAGAVIAFTSMSSVPGAAAAQPVAEGVTTATGTPGGYLKMSAARYARPGHRIYLAVTWTVSGREVDGTVNLQHKVDGRWTHVRKVRVVDGAVTTAITPGSTSDWRMRASSTTTSGVSTSDPAGTSNTVRITKVDDWDRSSAPQLAAARGAVHDGRAAFVVRWARATTALAGTVNLQRRTGSSWVHLRQVSVSSGRAEVTVPATTGGVYRLRASQAPGSTVTADPYGTSGSVTIAGSTPAPSTFRVAGSGWGHGVGMSQYGARSLAAAGSGSTTILTHYFTGTRVTTQDLSRSVRVQVLGGASSTSIRPSGGPARVRLGGSIVTTVPAGTSFSVAAVSSGLRVTVGSRTWTTSSPTGSVHVEWAATRYYRPSTTADVNVSVSGAQGRYRHGRLELRSISGRVNAVNVLRLNDEYMYGIAEMPSSWPAHALRAQAVAARSYAYANASSTKASCDCQLYDDTRSQNFTGWLKENETTYGARWVAAVDATTSSSTQGQVVTYRGSVIPAYYFSSSGGRTQNSEDVWVTALPWARSVSDAGSRDSVNPNASWSTTVRQATMRSAFGLSDVASVSITSRTAGNGVATATARSTSGATARITGEQLRTRLSLRSSWVSSIR